MKRISAARPAVLADAPEVARLAAQWGYAVSGQGMSSRLARLLASPSHSAFVAEGDGALLGWGTGELRFSLGSDPRVEITGLVVDAAVRRSGVGTLLVARIEQWALEQDCHEVFLRSSTARSEAHPFYQRLGFARRKTQHAYAKVLRAAAAPVNTAAP